MTTKKPRYSNTSNEPIKPQVEKLLKKNPMLLPKQICKILGFDHKVHGAYIRQIKHNWKYYSKNRLGLKGLSEGKFKNWHGWVYVPKTVDPKNAIDCGWIQTKAKNKFLLWKSNLGRLEWHPKTRRVKIGVKKPASSGKTNQLLSNAFFNTGLIYDLRIFEAFIEAVRFKRATYILETTGRLPYFKIPFLKDSNGVIIKGGDRSHPNAIEVTYSYPDWGEKVEGVMAKLNYTLEQLLTPKKKDRREPGDITYRV